MTPPKPLPFVTPREYRKDREHIFGSDESLRWFTRSNRAALAGAGALLAPNGRVRIDPVAFDRVVLEVGAQRAAGK